MIIGLHGESRSGKDSVARILQTECGFEWRSFASNLRSILLKINPYLPEVDMPLQKALETHNWDWIKAHSHSSVEQMIALGQSVRDLIHEDAWVWPVLREPFPDYLVISDCRQPNEFEAIKALDGEVWKIVRPGTTARSMDHYLDDYEFDVILNNTGTLEDLTLLVKEVFNDSYRRH